MKKKSNIASVLGICVGCILTGIGIGIMISNKSKGGHK